MSSSPLSPSLRLLAPREVARDSLPLLPTHFLPLLPALANTATSAAPKTQQPGERALLFESVYNPNYIQTGVWGSACLLAIYRPTVSTKEGLCRAGCPLTCLKSSRTAERDDNLSRWSAADTIRLLKLFFFFGPISLSHLFLFSFFCVIHLTAFQFFRLRRLDGAEVVQQGGGVGGGFE